MCACSLLAGYVLVHNDGELDTGEARFFAAKTPCSVLLMRSVAHAAVDTALSVLLIGLTAIVLVVRAQLSLACWASSLCAD